MTHRLITLWLPIAFAGTAILGGVYVGIQQDIRRSVNDPQIQMAEDAAHFLGHTYQPAGLFSNGMAPVDADRSLAPFLMVFSPDEKVIASSGNFSGTTLQPPAGVFDYARTHGRDIITWQTLSGARIAIVVMPVVGEASTSSTDLGFVLAGRNLREAEADEASLESFLFVAWMLMWLGTLIIVLMGSAYTAILEP